MLSRATLGALGLNTADILASAAGRLNGEVDMEGIHRELIEETEGKIAHMTYENIFHRSNGIADFTDG